MVIAGQFTAGMASWLKVMVPAFASTWDTMPVERIGPVACAVVVMGMSPILASAVGVEMAVVAEVVGCEQAVVANASAAVTKAANIFPFMLVLRFLDRSEVGKTRAPGAPVRGAGSNNTPRE